MHFKFYYGTMGSGKTTAALQYIYDLERCEADVKVWSGMQREPGVLKSRMGFSVPAEEFSDDTNFFDDFSIGSCTHIVVDEAQFLSVDQVDQLIKLVDHFSINVTTFGLLVTFKGDIFPASQRMLALAGKGAEQLPITPSCSCGETAVVPARFINGKIDVTGPLFMVGDLDSSDEIEYISLCREHFMAAKEQLNRS